MNSIVVLAGAHPMMATILAYVLTVALFAAASAWMFSHAADQRHIDNRSSTA